PVHLFLRGHQPRGGPPVRRDRPADPPGHRPDRTRVSETATPLAALEGLDERAGSDFWRRFRQSRNARLGGALLLVVTFAAIAGPWLAPHRYQDTDLLAVWAEPSRDHVLGGDALGRDVLSRLILGARISLLVAGSVLGLTLTIGTLAGMVAGY